MDDTTKIYPYCYKIKDDCPPCKMLIKSDNCIKLLAKYLVLKSSRFTSQQYLNKAYMKLGDCLKKYGDMYKKVGIELYVNPKTKEIIFPNNQRIIANYNVFLNDIGMLHLQSTEEENFIDEKINIYEILLNDKLREVYNDFYKKEGFSEQESIMPKEYGIARIMGPNIEKNGGKRRRKTNKKLKKRSKTKRRIYNKIDLNK